jgi:hypothetical protein
MNKKKEEKFLNFKFITITITIQERKMTRSVNNLKKNDDDYYQIYLLNYNY